MSDQSPESVFDAVSAALLAATGLLGTEAILGQGNTPSSLLHRKFRLNPADCDAGPGKARPGDVQALIEKVQVIVTHEIQPGNNLASFRLASQDFTAVLRTVLTRREVSGFLQPYFKGRTIRTVGHTLEQTIRFELHYHIALPATE